MICSRWAEVLAHTDIIWAPSAVPPLQDRLIKD
jgi:hypothetical protein